VGQQRGGHAYGRFEEIPSEVFRAVIETNLLGMTHGARAALARFRRQQSGTLINMASVWERVTFPDVSAYVTSRFAVLAFSDCLREELADAPGIDVVTILPQAVDTPIFEQAANYSGRRVRPIPPLSEPEDVAKVS
jgi:NAD(P)-dependent dehydrogenase (short-subunit alcohol dehydrogenase family)